MHVREEWKQRVSAQQGALAVLLVIVLLGGMGIVYMKNGTLPMIPSVFYGVLLAIVWARVGWDCWRHGKAALPLGRVFYLIGFSAYFGGNMMPLGMVLREGVINLGLVVVLAFFALSIFGPRKHRQTPRDVSL